VFFLQTSPEGAPTLWVGSGDGRAELDAIRRSKVAADTPFDLHPESVAIPFRVAAVPLNDGSHIYLGLSEKDEIHVLRNLRVRFLLWWLLNVLLGFGIVFFTARGMLLEVEQITQAASRIGDSDLRKRVPGTGRNDEVGQLASTLNRMLDRIEKSVHQVHTITNSLAHDLRSPLTAIRVKMEVSLLEPGRDNDALVSAIEEVDRLTEILNKCLDVAEANADALRIERTTVDLDQLLRTMIELYEPCMSENGLRIQVRSLGAVQVSADTALLHRMMVNLFDNELKHLPPPCTVNVSLGSSDGFAVFVLQDDGPGFASEVSDNLFKPRVKGLLSGGSGLGLAFVEAVVNAHGGEVTALNRREGGAQITIKLPLAAKAMVLGG
jgi:signal transduction histidine kinase